MELGQRLKQARLEAGLSQRQLSEGIVTRNMLSLIENGSARPSMDTLRSLADRLGKSISFFLEEEGISPNQQLMERARTARGRECLAILEGYQTGDPVFDREKNLLEALTCMELARTALREGRYPYARKLLDRAGQAGRATPYYKEPYEAQRLLLLREAGEDPEALDRQLPSLDTALYLRAEAALSRQEYARCAALLGAVEEKIPRWFYLLGMAAMGEKRWQEAAGYLQKGEPFAPRRVWQALEVCFRELGDFKSAYFYACKQR